MRQVAAATAAARATAAERAAKRAAEGGKGQAPKEQRKQPPPKAKTSDWNPPTPSRPADVASNGGGSDM